MTYDGANRLKTYNGQNVTYDEKGNMTYGPVDGKMQELTYDCRNRLVEAGGVSYTYDAENTRISTTENGLTTEYVTDTGGSLSRLLVAYEADNTETTYYYGAEGLAAEYNNGTDKYFAYHYDNIGSTTLITAKDGHAVEWFSYGTYGELLKDAITKIRFLYNGSYGVMTDSNGLYYMRARYYNPDIKRFINQDIKVGDIGSSQSLNRYAYCEGNPVSMVDPFGLCGKNTNLWKDLLDNLSIHDWLGFAGFALNAAGPAGVVLAAVCDVVDAAIYFKEGNYVQGAISLMCAIPSIGDAVAAVKSGTQIAKNIKTVGNVIRSAQKLYVTAASASKALELAGDAKLEYAVNGGEMTASVRAKILGTVILSGMAAVSGRSLAKDVGRFAKATSEAMPRFKTAAQEGASQLKHGAGNTRLNTYGDALREKLGPAYLSHTDEYNSILSKAKEMGVTIEFRGGTLAYDMELGKAGKLIIDPEASIGALRHEYRHVLDDFELGHPGMRIIADKHKFWKLEFRGYLEELNLAREIKDYDAGRFILKEMRQRRNEILGK